REFEETAIAFHSVHEAEDAIEPRAVVGPRLPGDNLAAQRFEHLAAFGYEIGNQVVHRRNRPSALALKALCRGGVNAALAQKRRQLRGSCAPIVRAELDGSDNWIEPPASVIRLCASQAAAARGSTVPWAPFASVSRSTGSSRIRGPSARTASSTASPLRSVPTSSRPPRTSASPAIKARLSS